MDEMARAALRQPLAAREIRSASYSGAGEGLGGELFQIVSKS